MRFLPRSDGPSRMQLWRARNISVTRIADRARKAADRERRAAARPLQMTWTRQALIAAVPVAAVAVIAGIVSYGHIETLALSVHQYLAAARMLPGSVDFLIVGGSVILLCGSQLGWLGVIPGVAATLFANVESGLPYGPLSATVAAWPAVAFTLATLMLERWLKKQSVTSGTLAPAGAGTGLPAPPRQESRPCRGARPGAGGGRRRRWTRTPCWPS